MPTTGTTPAPGQIARVRQRLYLVEETVPPPSAGDSSLVKLSCVDDDAQGQHLEVLWERELDAEVMKAEAWDAIAQRGFDSPSLFSAYLNTLRWNCVTATDPRLFQSPFRAGIKLDAYQLEPLQKALLLPRVNLFIADDVGLGKTIEAGLIARELLLRKKAREIIVSCPPSMLLQWQDEMENRFGLVFEILDKDYVQRVRRERGFGVNPWSTHPRFLISQRLLIDEGYAGPLRDWLGDFRSGTLLILDEATPCCPFKWAEVRHRFKDHPRRSGTCAALRAPLVPLGDAAQWAFQQFLRPAGDPGPSAFLPWRSGRQEPLERRHGPRLKDDLRETRLGTFPLRRVLQLDIDGLPPDAPELRLAGLLDEYRQLREERLSGESRRKQAAAGLLITGLQQRLLSSIEAFARTLRVHRKTVQRYWEEPEAASAKPAQPEIQFDLLATSPGSDDDRATLPETELQAEEEAQITAATAATTPTHDKGTSGYSLASSSSSIR